MPRPVRRVMLAAAAVALLALLVPPFVNVNRYKLRIAATMSGAIGRQVTVGDISLRLLPQPGFVMQNVVIADDPAFSAEPMLRADEVAAYLRLTSLWRGRLEIARLSLSYPSLNLVRNAEGRWNLEALLTRAQQTPTAPTSKTKPEARPRFPYIEADDGRINLKLGQVKSEYALTEAEFALWLPSEDEWRMRLVARPIRTDARLSDTGTLRVQGTFQRGSAKSATPIQFDVEWREAQLGQVTQLIYGRDRGWRGEVNLRARVGGSFSDVNVGVEATVDEFRRYDIKSSTALRLQARCSATYSRPTQSLSDLLCQSPAGGGVLETRGTIRNLFRQQWYDVSVSASDVSANALAQFLRRAKRDLPDDLVATGTIDAAVTIRTVAENAKPEVEGGGRSTPIQLSSSTLDSDVSLGAMKFSLSNPVADVAAARRKKRGAAAAPTGTWVLAVSPFTVDLAGTAPANVRALIGRTAYTIDVTGGAEIGRLIDVAQGFGFRATALRAKGPVTLDLRISGPWQGFEPPKITGAAQVRNAMIEMRGVATAIKLVSADVLLAPSDVRVTSLSATLAGTDATFTGQLQLPRNCSVPVACAVRFDLASPELSLDQLNTLLNPQAPGRPWYRRFALSGGGETRPSLLRELAASGRLSVGKLHVKRLVANKVVAQAQMARGRLVLTDVRAEIAGGKHRGEWKMDFTATTPAYSGSGVVEQASLATVSGLTGDNWATGALDISYRLTASGWNAQQWLDSATGTGIAEWRDGTLRHVALDGGGGPLRVRKFTARLDLASRVLTLAQGQLLTAGDEFQVSGSASFSRQLSIQLQHGSQNVYAVTGTLEAPKVVRAQGSARAALKP